VPVGSFARGGDGVLVVAPAAEEMLPSTNARCSVYAGAHHPGEDGGWGGEGDTYGRAKSMKKKAAKMKGKKYPKRQGGKFRARTAGG